MRYDAFEDRSRVVFASSPLRRSPRAPLDAPRSRHHLRRSLDRARSLFVHDISRPFVRTCACIRRLRGFDKNTPRETRTRIGAFPPCETRSRSRAIGDDDEATFPRERPRCTKQKKHKTTRTSPRSRVYSRFADRSSAMLIADRARVPSTPSRTHHRRAWADSSRLTQGNGTVAAAAAPLGARWTRAIPPPRSRR